MSNKHFNKGMEYFFNLSKEESEEFFEAFQEQEDKENFSYGLPKVTRDERCTAENQFIHTYEDGRQELVAHDIYTQTDTVIKRLK